MTDGHRQPVTEGEQDLDRTERKRRGKFEVIGDLVRVVRILVEWFDDIRDHLEL